MAVLDDAAVETRGRWKPYPEYRDSGLDWLGEVPSRWNVKRLKLLARLRYGLGQPPDESPGGVPLIRATNINRGEISDTQLMRVDASQLSTDRGTRLYEGEILVVRSGAYTGDSAIIPLRWSGALPGYDMVVSPTGTVPKFLAWQLLSTQVSQLQFGFHTGRAAQPHLNVEQLGETMLTLPPPDEQRVIAAFLDRETAGVDALITKKEQLIALLAEHRSAVISGAAEAGSPQRLMTLTAYGRPIMYGIVLPGPNVPDGVPIIKGGDVDHGRLDPKLLNRTTFEIDASHARSRVRAGDIVYAIRGSIGSTTIVPDSLDGANITQDAARISPRDDVDRRWLHYVLSSKVVFAQLEAGSVGATIRGINIRDLKRAVVRVPPYEEQRRIADQLDRETARIDALVSKVRDHIALLREYRSALISAAVTGKIDVRDEVVA